MGKTAIVTGGTSNDVPAMGVLALNIRKKIPDLADNLIIFHDGITPEDQRIIDSIFPTDFYKFHFPVSFLDNRKNSYIRYFSPMVFCKYECLRLLEDYERVIWTDYDIVILKSLNELKESNAGLQIVDERNPLKHNFKDEGECLKGQYNLEKPGVSTPLFVVTRAIGDYQKLYHWCIDNTKKYMPYIELPEQCIISMMIQKFSIDYESLLDLKYCIHPKHYDGNASIIHAYGRPKFWEGLLNEDWESYYKEWITLGGSPYKTSFKKKIENMLNRNRV